MFQHCSQTELYLINMGVKFSYQDNLSYDHLVSDWNLKNLGRPEGQNRIDEAVESYASLMEQGSAAPAVILMETREGYDVLDGCQRLSANELTGATRICGFLVKCSQDIALKIRLFSNMRLNGRAPADADYCVETAIREFMIHGADSAEDIASFAGCPVSHIVKRYDRLVTIDAIDGAYATQGKKSPKLKKGEYDSLSQYGDVSDFSKAPKGMIALVDLLHKCQFKNGHSEQVIKNVLNIKRTASKDRETQIRSKLRQQKKDPVVSARITGSKKQTAVETIDRHFKGLLGLVKDHKKSKSEFDDVELIECWSEMYFEIGRLLREQCSTTVRRKLDPFN